VISIFLFSVVGFKKSFSEGSAEKQFEETCTKECLIGLYVKRFKTVAPDSASDLNSLEVCKQITVF